MVTESFQGQGLPDDFANRIGRLIEARGSIVDALFDPTATPDILTELSISDEANRRAIDFHVAQRLAPQSRPIRGAGPLSSWKSSSVG